MRRLRFYGFRFAPSPGYACSKSVGSLAAGLMAVGMSPTRRSSLNSFRYDWLVRGCKWTFGPFHRRVVTTYALEVGAAGDGNNRDQSFSAFRATRCPIHEILPYFSPITRNWKFCSIRAPSRRTSEVILLGTG